MSKVARFQTYPSGDDPALVVAQTKRAIRSGDRVAFRDLSKRIATSIETYWHETWNGVERTTPADQSPNYVNNLQAKVNLLVAAGMTLIESGSQEWLAEIFESLERVEKLGTQTLLGNQGYKPREIAVAPTGTLLFAYVALMAMAIKMKDAVSIKELASLEFEEDDGFKRSVISNGFIAYPIALGGQGSEAWTHVIEQWDTSDWLEEFFVEKPEYEKYARQVNFLMSLICVAKRYQRLGGGQYFPFPIYRMGSIKEAVALLKTLSYRDRFAVELATTVFAETFDEFIAAYPDRCGQLNAYPDRGTLWHEALPCDIFQSNTD